MASESDLICDSILEESLDMLANVSATSGTTETDEVLPATAQDCNLKILSNQHLCDITFLVGKEEVEIKCHKIFLMARSPVFKAKYSERWGGELSSSSSNSNLNNTVEHLPDEDPKIFMAFIEFIYGDKLSNDITDIMKILPLADFYGVEPLMKKCEHLMSKAGNTIEYAFEMYKASFQYNMKYLRLTSGRFIASKIVDLHTHASFENLDEATLEHLLQRTDLQADELEIFQIVRHWGKIQQLKNPACKGQEEREILKNLIQLVHFPNVSSEQFSQQVVPTNILSKEEMLNIFVYLTSKWEDRNKIYDVIPFRKALRGCDSTIDLYHSDGNKRKMDVDVKQPAVLQQDVLSFSFEYEQPPTGLQNLAITKIFLRGPVLPSSTAKEIVEKNRECNITISIMAFHSEVWSTKFTLTKKVTAGENTAHRIPPIKRFPLFDKSKYAIRVGFSCELPVVKNVQINNNVDTSVDPATFYSLRPSVSKSNKIGSYKLHNFRIATYLRNQTAPVDNDSKYLVSLQSYPFHTIRGFKLKFF